MHLILRRGFDNISERNVKRDGYYGPTLNGIKAVTSDSLMYFDGRESFEEAGRRTRWPAYMEQHCLQMRRHENGSLLIWNEFTSEAEFYYYEELQQ